MLLRYKNNNIFLFYFMFDGHMLCQITKELGLLIDRLQYSTVQPETLKLNFTG